MKYKLFRAPFLTISSNLAYNCQIKIFTWCLEGSTSPIKMVLFLFGLPPYDNFKISPFPQPICSSKSYEYGKYDKTTYRVSRLLLDPPGKTDQQAIHCPTANFQPLSRGSITNPMLIIVFDTYLTTRSPGAWV